MPVTCAEEAVIRADFSPENWSHSQSMIDVTVIARIRSKMGNHKGTGNGQVPEAKLFDPVSGLHVTGLHRV